MAADEWEALAQVMAAQLPRVAHEAKGVAAAEKAVDAARRQMVWAAIQQKKAAEEAGRGWEAWRQRREEHRGWMRLVVRGWRTAVVAQRAMLARGTRAAQQRADVATAGLQPRALMAAAEDARRASKEATEEHGKPIL